MNEYKTKYAIGDLVYTADANDIDRDVIKAIKITGLKSTVSYGFKQKSNNPLMWGYLWGSSDGYNWYKSSEIFEDKESALSLHESLKAKKEVEDAIESAKEKADRKAELLEELKELES